MQNWEGKSVLNLIDLVETKCYEGWLITNIWVTFVKKDFKIQTLIKQLLTKHQFFMKLPQITHNHKICNFTSVIGLF